MTNKKEILYVLNNLHKCEDVGERCKILNFIIDNISDPHTIRQNILKYESDLRICRRITKSRCNLDNYENKKVNGEWIKIPFNFTEQEKKIQDFVESSEKIVDLMDYFSKNVITKIRDKTLTEILNDPTQTR